MKNFIDLFFCLIFLIRIDGFNIESAIYESEISAYISFTNFKCFNYFFQIESKYNCPNIKCFANK